ncbi:MAG: Rossmann-like domain-containing protein [Candidatus Promineifilaceae bacterium]
MSRLLDELLSSIQDAEVSRVLIGLHWTAVVTESPEGASCGLASTLCGPHGAHGKPDLIRAGDLDDLSGLSLSIMARSENLVRASVGIATINALLPKNPSNWVDLNAEEVIARQGRSKKVVMIGHFPFADRLRERVGDLIVLEQRPQPGDLPSSLAVEILPKAEVAAITGTSLINHSLEGLLALLPSTALTILMGPSTPLSPILFDYGIHILCGAVVTSIKPVLNMVEQGGNFRQVHRAGVRTVTMAQSDYN